MVNQRWDAIAIIAWDIRQDIVKGSQMVHARAAFIM
jgi:hypothetical protein